jgi:hypothetical protein
MFPRTVVVLVAMLNHGQETSKSTWRVQQNQNPNGLGALAHLTERNNVAVKSLNYGIFIGASP